MQNYSTNIEDTQSLQILIILDGLFKLQTKSASYELSTSSCVYIDDNFLSIEAADPEYKILLIKSAPVKLIPECDELTLALIDEDFFSSPKSIEYRQSSAQYIKNRINIEIVEESDKEESPIDQITDFVRTHLDEKLSIKLLMDEFSISRMKLIRLFQKHELGSVMHYVKALRLEKAKELLEESELSVNQIALSCGFADTASFSHFLKKNLNKSPSQIRSEKQWLM